MKTVINIKTDKDLKDKAVATAAGMGLPLSIVVNSFLKKFISDKSITFTAPLKPSKYLERILLKAKRDIKAGRNLSPLFTNTEKMDEYLAGL